MKCCNEVLKGCNEVFGATFLKGCNEVLKGCNGSVERL